MKTIKIKIYKFEELSKESKDRAIELNRDINVFDDYSQVTLDEATEQLAKAGFIDAKIYYSGFWSQGDGASFSCYIDVVKWIKTMRKSKDYPMIIKYSGFVNGNIKAGNSYYQHSNTMSIDLSNDYVTGWYDTNRKHEDKLYDELEKIEPLILDDARNRADTIYDILEKEYEYLTSDEAVAETLIINDYMFTENGDIYYAN